MSRFYKMDPGKWDNGTANLSLEEEAAYLRIVNSINLHDAPVPNVDRVLAGMFRVSTRKARSLRDALIEAGKIYIEGDHIWNEKARFDVNSRSIQSEKSAESGAEGGRVSGEQRRKSLKDNKSMQAPASPRIEENRIEKDPPNPPRVGKRKLDEIFERWWVHYPRKVSKGAARKAFSKALPKSDEAALTASVKRFALSVMGKDHQYIPHAATWLNHERWMDGEGSTSDPTQPEDPEKMRSLRLERAKDWLSRHSDVPTWMDNRQTADDLMKEGYEYEALRSAGFSLPPRGKVINIHTGQNQARSAPSSDPIRGHSV